MDQSPLLDPARDTEFPGRAGVEHRDGSPSLLFRGGWRPKSLQSGDKITVRVHPLRDGTNGGLFVSATFADGRPIGGSR